MRVPSGQFPDIELPGGLRLQDVNSKKDDREFPTEPGRGKRNLWKPCGKMLGEYYPVGNERTTLHNLIFTVRYTYRLQSITYRHLFSC